MKHLLKLIQKDCEFCAKEIQRDVITPNILLHVLSLDPIVHSELVFNNTDIKLLGFILNPYHARGNPIHKVKLSREVKEIFEECEAAVSRHEVFMAAMRHEYVREIIAKAGYMVADGEDSLLAKYCMRITGGKLHTISKEAVKKIRMQYGKRNIMIMGAIGSGRYEFIKNFAKEVDKDITIYYFDLFTYLKIDKERLFGIIHGIFDELGDNMVYIPNFIQTLAWVKGLNLVDVYTLLEELSTHGKIITKINNNKFDTTQYVQSKQFHFFSLNVKQNTVPELFDIVKKHAQHYEKFYGVTIAQKDIRTLVHTSNFQNPLLSQPGRALKALMHLTVSLYAGEDGIIENLQHKKEHPENISLNELLKKDIIGQEKALNEIELELKKANFLQSGIVSTMLFQGEMGCGRLKTAREVSKLLFGYDSLRYINMQMFQEYPYKLKIYEAIDELVDTLYGGIIYLDNIDALNSEEIDIVAYIRMKVQELLSEDIYVPVIIIGATKKSLNEIQQYKYLIENFHRLIFFNKLTSRDLEQIADKEIMKIKKVMPNAKREINAFAISANANSEMNALSIKKLVTSAYL